MSRTRMTHPGYNGVLMAMALPWYVGLGLAFLLGSHTLGSIFSYRLVFHYVPPLAWGVWYVALGLALAFATTIHRVPHRYVRWAAAAGWSTTFFFLITFIVVDIATGKIPSATLIPAFATMLMVEFRAVVEPEVNPLSVRRRRNAKHPLRRHDD